MDQACDSRRLLSRLPVADASETTSDEGPYPSLHANAVTVLVVLLCTVICALAINAAFRCLLAMLSRSRFEPEPPCSLDGGLVLDWVRRKEAIKAMPSLAYYPGLGAPRTGLECTICMSEFEPGELVRVLPMCNHGFHVECIDRWLVSQPSCPTCRHSLQLYVVEQEHARGLS